MLTDRLVTDGIQCRRLVRDRLHCDAHHLLGEEIRAAIIRHPQGEAVRPHLARRRRPGKGAGIGIEARANRHRALETIGQAVRRDIVVTPHRREAQQLPRRHRLRRDGLERRLLIDFAHRHRERLAIGERRAAVVRHHHIKRERPGPLHFGWRPTEHASRRIDACARRD